MPERIPELDEFVNQTAFVRGLPAAEIRRRGDRRRTTRRVTGGVLGAALIAAAGFGVVNSPLFGNKANPIPAQTASPSPTATPSPTTAPSPSEKPSATVTETVTQPVSTVRKPTVDNLPTVDELFPYNSQIDEPLTITFEDSEGLGQAAKGLCDPGEYGNPSTTLVRDFKVEGNPGKIAVVFGYDTAEQASAGMKLLGDAARNCASQINTDHFTKPWATESTKDLEDDLTGISAQVSQARVFEAGGLIPDRDTGIWNITTLVQAGERVLWVTDTFEGQDYNCSLKPDDVAGQCENAKSLTAVYDRLHTDN